MHRVRLIVLTLWLMSSCLFSCSTKPDRTVQLAQHTSGPYEIRGRVLDPRLGASDAAFERLERFFREVPLEQIESHSEVSDREVEAFFAPQPVPGVFVILRTTDEYIQQVETDGEGRFSFRGLPSGQYALGVIDYPMPPDRNIDWNGWQTIRGVLIQDSNRDVELIKPEPVISLTGRVLDPEGRPIAGAEVTGMPVPILETGIPPTFSAVSDADGVYVYEGLSPVHLYRIAGYLNGGSLESPGSLYTRLEIRVEAEGYTQAKSDIPRVPLITENLLAPARRFHQLLGIVSKRVDPDRVWEQKPGVYLPESRGDTIIGIDLVMQPVDPPDAARDRE
jgi:hypothetical protein